MKKLFSLVCVLAVSMFVLGCAEEKKPATPVKPATPPATDTNKKDEVKKEEVKKEEVKTEVKTEEKTEEKK